MRDDTAQALRAVRAQPWAILPEYLAAIEALAARALENPALAVVAEDGHQARLEVSLGALAAVGQRLEGARTATVRNGVAVLPILGPIFPRANLVNSSAGGTSLDVLMSDWRVAQASDAVDRILLLTDSPGGVVSGLGEAADTLRASAKPTTAFVTGMAASAAYWLASQAGELVLENAASVGSIGVVRTVSVPVQPSVEGYRDYEIVSSGAPRKRPDPGTPEGLEAAREELDAIEAVFVSDVAAGRKRPAASVRRDFGRGGMVSAAQAVQVGMADRIGTLEATLQGMARRAPAPAANRRAAAERDLDLRRRRAT